MPAVGRRVWAIAEGWIPDHSHGPEPQIHGHQVVSREGGQDGELDGVGLRPKWCDHPHAASAALP